MYVPASTYRLQFMPQFTFAEAEEIVPYLAELGIGAVYSSPVFKACPGSEHGYDVVDPSAINEELGGFEGLRRVTRSAQEAGLGWVQDIVPNHMAIDQHNRWFMDVIENGPGSRYFEYFDIDWDHYYEGIRNRLLAPFLGSFFGEAIERGEIGLHYGEDGLTVRYYDVILPLRIESYGAVLKPNLDKLCETMGQDNPDFVGFVAAIDILDNLPTRDRTDARYRQIAFGKNKLWHLHQKDAAIQDHMANCLKEINGVPERPESFDRLDAILGEQYFRLSFWKVATEEINYRRFFTINDLICMRLEIEAVFDHSHEMIKRLVDDRLVNGIRVDHVDGLYDPLEYLTRLRRLAPEAYTVVEKILENHESLPASWPVQGTTGYDALNAINGLFCSQAGRLALQNIYSRVTGSRLTYFELVVRMKRLIAEKHLAGDIDNLAHTMKRISARDRYGNDITLYSLRKALIEVMACFPVYRTYVNGNEISDPDEKHIHDAVARALDFSPDLEYELRFIRGFLLFESYDVLTEAERQETLRFIMRFQQLTGPLMAKGVEDTTCYIYNRLVSLNEVGGSPDRFGVTAEEFHKFCRDRVKNFPASMSSLTTHDTKRGEDVRARINVLSEIREEWDTAVHTWMNLNGGLRRRVKGKYIPDRNDEYFLYQTLIGTYPVDDKVQPHYIERMKNYVVKAVREAKIHTAWLKPDEEYENSFVEFVEKILTPSDDNRFLREFRTLLSRVAHYGIFNSLSQKVLHLTMPGMPDIYQGAELWDFRLVDPDNRRPVDFDRRQTLLEDIKRRADQDLPALLRELIEHPQDGRIKLYVTWRTLNFRKSHADVFGKGEYLALQASGAKSDHIIALARRLASTWIVCVAPRLVANLVSAEHAPLGDEVWSGNSLRLPDESPTQWRELYSGNRIESTGNLKIGRILNSFPVAILIGGDNVR